MLDLSLLLILYTATIITFLLVDVHRTYFKILKIEQLSFTLRELSRKFDRVNNYQENKLTGLDLIVCESCQKTLPIDIRFKILEQLRTALQTSSDEE